MEDLDAVFAQFGIEAKQNGAEGEGKKKKKKDKKKDSEGGCADAGDAAAKQEAAAQQPEAEELENDENGEPVDPAVVSCRTLTLALVRIWLFSTSYADRCLSPSISLSLTPLLLLHDRPGSGQACRKAQEGRGQEEERERGCGGRGKGTESQAER